MILIMFKWIQIHKRILKNWKVKEIIKDLKSQSFKIDKLKKKRIKNKKF